MRSKDTEEFRKHFPFANRSAYQLYWDGTGDMVAALGYGKDYTRHSSVSDTVLSESREDRFRITGKRTKRGYVFQSWRLCVTRGKEDLVGTENEDTTAFNDCNAFTPVHDFSTMSISL